HEAADAPLRRGQLEEVARLEGDDGAPTEAGKEEGDEAGAEDEAALLQELGHIEGTLEDPAHGRGEQDRLIAKRHKALSGSASQLPTPSLKKQRPTQEYSCADTSSLKRTCCPVSGGGPRESSPCTAGYPPILRPWSPIPRWSALSCPRAMKQATSSRCGTACRQLSELPSSSSAWSTTAMTTRQNGSARCSSAIREFGASRVRVPSARAA